MELKQAIYERRSVRVFQDKPVEKEKIEKIIDAAQWAPSACNKQEWRFIAVDDYEIKKQFVEKSGANKLIIKAPLAIVVIYNKSITVNKQSNFQSAAAATQNVLLRAHSLGIGSTWMTGLGNIEEISKTLSIPSDYEVVSVVMMGYPKEQNFVPKRKELNHILSYNKYNFSEGAYPTTYDPTKWSHELLKRFREDGLRATNPRENSFPFNLASESKKEIDVFSSNLNTDDNILEILSLAGTHTLRMMQAKNYKNYNLFELSSGPLDFTKHRFLNAKKEFDCDVKTGALDKLPYDDNTFDTILCFQKLETLPNLEILDEIKRILKPKGKLIVSFRNKTGLFGLYYWYNFIFKKEPVWNYGPFKPLGYFSLKKSLQKKFKINKQYGITPLFFIGKKVKGQASILSRLIVFELENND